MKTLPVWCSWTGLKIKQSCCNSWHCTLAASQDAVKNLCSKARGCCLSISTATLHLLQFTCAAPCVISDSVMHDKAESFVLQTRSFMTWTRARTARENHELPALHTGCERADICRGAWCVVRSSSMMHCRHILSNNMPHSVHQMKWRCRVC